MSVVFILRPMCGIVVDVGVRVNIFPIAPYHMVVVPLLPDVMSDLVIAVSFE